MHAARTLAILLAPLLLVPTRAFAVDLIDLAFDSVQVLAQGIDAPCDSLIPEQTLFQGDSVVIDVVCTTVEFTLQGNTVSAFISPTAGDPSIALMVLGGSFSIPNIGLLVPVAFERYVPASRRTGSAAVFSFGIGILGGDYGPSQGTEERQPASYIGGDTITDAVAFSATQMHPSELTEMTPLVSLFTVGSFPTECSDGMDNDGDGSIDLDDKQCKSAEQNSERKPNE